MTQDRKKRGRPANRTGKNQRPFNIVFEDSHLIVVDKQAGLLTVPIPDKHSRNLKELLDSYLVSQKRRAMVVHRIDRYTSGLVVFAKNAKARELLVEQFRAHTPERIYLALVRGNPGKEGTLKHYLKLVQDGFRQVVVGRDGTLAVTHFKMIEELGDVSLLEVRLDTGLKNQIRVQFGAAGHPLVGDRHYSPAEAHEVLLKRQALHSHRLSFFHPIKNRKVTFEAPLPHDMEKLVARLRRVREKSRISSD